MKIFYANHDNLLGMLDIPYLIPIQSGAKNAPVRFECLHDDDSVDNISDKNNLYAELSVQYYIWKNMSFDEDEPIGFFQEKRMLLDNFIANDKNTLQFLNAPGNPTKFVRYTVEKDKIKEIIKNIVLKDNYNFSYYDFITRHSTFWLPLVPQKVYFSIYQDVRILKLIEEAMEKYFPEYLSPFYDVLNYTNHNIADNVFVAKWKNFKAYSEWLFTIIFHVEENLRKIDPNFLECSLQCQREAMQRGFLNKTSEKIFAWLGELLFIVFLLKNRMVRIEKWIGEFYIK